MYTLEQFFDYIFSPIHCIPIFIWCMCVCLCSTLCLLSSFLSARQLWILSKFGIRIVFKVLLSILLFSPVIIFDGENRLSEYSNWFIRFFFFKFYLYVSILFLSNIIQMYSPFILAMLNHFQIDHLYGTTKLPNIS